MGRIRLLLRLEKYLQARLWRHAVGWVLLRGFILLRLGSRSGLSGSLHLGTPAGRTGNGVLAVVAMAFSGRGN